MTTHPVASDADELYETSPGSRTTFGLALPPLPNGSAMTLPVAVLRGTSEGPTAWISAAIHGDEINGTQIIRRLLATIDPSQLAGTLLIAPIVDVYGFNTSSRYLPDRRDLNRSFPGSSHGPLAAQLAHRFVASIVDHSDFGIDLHTGSDGRTNLPQVRGDIEDANFLDLARAFSPPVIVASRTIGGSLREYCNTATIPYLLYEAGQAARFDADAINMGVRGCLRLLDHMDMLPIDAATDADRCPDGHEPPIAHRSQWVRSPKSGIFVSSTQLGAHMQPTDLVGVVGDSFGEQTESITAGESATVIGMTLDPIVEAGDPLVHLAMSL